MASEYNQDGSTKISAGVSLLKTVAALSPVAVGVWQAQRSLASNVAINNPLSKKTPHQLIGKALGKRASDSQASRGKRAQQAVERIKAALQQGIAQDPELRDIINSVSQHNALLQTMSVTLESSAAGLDTTAVQSLKADIASAMSGGSATDIERLATNVVDTLLNSGSPETLLQWEQNFSEFSAVHAQLEVPDFNVSKSGQSFNPISVGSIKGSRAASRFERLQGVLPQGFHAEVFSAPSPGGGNPMIQAQVFGSGGRWRASVPLQLGGGTSGPGGQRGTFMRTGADFNTMYAAPGEALNVQAAYRHARTSGFGNLGADALRQAGAITGFEDYWIGQLGQRAQQGDLNFTTLNRDMREALMIVDRNAMGTGTLSSHVRSQIRSQTNVLFGHTFGPLDGNEGINFISRLATGAGMEAGAGGSRRLLTGHGANRRAIIGLERGSGFSHLQSVYGEKAVNRTTLPITARESQVLGRPSMVEDPFRLIGGGHVGIGGTGRLTAAEMAKQNIGWGNQITGGVNNFMMVDFSETGRLRQELSGLGMAYSAKGHRTTKPISLSAFDPRAGIEGHSYAASNTLNRVMRSGDAGVTISAAEANEGRYFGETSAGRKMVGRDPGLVSMHLRHTNAGQSYGKNMLYFSGEVTRDIDYGKLFSLTFKGNVYNRGTEGIDRLVQQDVRFKQAERNLEAAGLGGLRHEAVYAASDAFKKGEFMFIHQIASSARQHGVGLKALRAEAEGLAKPLLGDSSHGRFAQAAFNLMRRGGVDSGAIGMALAGVYHGVGKNRKFGLDRAALENMTGVMSEGDKKNAIRAMQRGIVGFVDTAEFGESVGDWRQGRVGAEARFGKTAYERLRAFGMAGKGAGDIVANMYMNKVGLGRHFAMAEQMMAMGRSLVGQRNAFDAFSEKGAQRVSWGKLAETLKDGTETLKLGDYLRKQKHGMVLSFADAPAHMLRAVQEIFGQDSLYLPGRPAFEAAPGTTIKQASGLSTDVAGAYGQQIEGLYGRLNSYSKSGQGDALRTSLRLWQREGIDLMSRTVAGLASGKLSGSSSPRVKALTLNRALTLTPKQAGRANVLFRGSNTNAVMADATMFLSEIHGQQGKAKPAELSRRAREFFTAQELDLDEKGNYKQMISGGQIRVSGRHPMMSSGNVFFTQMYRDVEEISGLGGKDKFFDRIMNEGMMVGPKDARVHKTGLDMMTAINQDLATVSSFADIAKHSRAKQGQFFNELVRNISRFTGGEGGGTLTIMRLLTNEGDIGLAPQAFMDADGDTAVSVTLSSGDAHKVRSLLANQSESQIGQELRYRTVMDKLGSKIKQGIVAYGGGGTTVAQEALELENIKKEMGTAQQTGAMDVRLRPMHDALMNFGDGGQGQRVNRALLGALEEHVILKAKHMERYAPLADEVGSAVQGLMKSPSEESAERLRSILMDKVFKGVKETDFSVGKINVLGDARGDVKRDLQGFLNRTTGTGSLAVSVSGSVDEMLRVSRLANSSNTAMGTTHGAMTQRMLNDPQGHLIDVMNGQFLEAAALKESSNNLAHQPSAAAHGIEQIKAAMGKLDKRAMLPIAIGAGISMMAMGAVGSPGYAATPLRAPGEHVSPEVQEAIAKGNLFGNRDPHVEQGSMGQGAAGHGMMNTPINTGATRMQRPTAYSIRGQMSNYSGLREAGAYINQMTGGSGHGSIRVNDNRRPITRSYVDRLLGEY